jgi:hypothetical protein
LSNAHLVGRDAEVVVDGVPERHGDHGPDRFAVAVEVVPFEKLLSF